MVTTNGYRLKINNNELIEFISLLRDSKINLLNRDSVEFEIKIKLEELIKNEKLEIVDIKGDKIHEDFYEPILKKASRDILFHLIKKTDIDLVYIDLTENNKICVLWNTRYISGEQ